MPPEMAGAVAEAGTGSESTEPIESQGEVTEGAESGAETTPAGMMTSLRPPRRFNANGTWTVRMPVQAIPKAPAF